MGDNELLLLLKEHPDKGIEQFMRQYTGLIYSIVSGRAGNAVTVQDIEECVSDVIFEIYQKAESFDLSKGTLQAYASVVARSRAINLFNKGVKELARTSSTEIYDDSINISGFEDDVIETDERRHLIEIIKSLGEPDGTIIFRKYYFGQKSKDIAIDLGFTTIAIDTRISRAKAKLRTILGGKL
ncbi:MAG: sigma-70 family RNA polymerase sigma factor [Clostridiales bacterium]|nr:sigma-70 family RNA polymerase sigma factor [Clostridiales bacterium]